MPDWVGRCGRWPRAELRRKAAEAERGSDEPDGARYKQEPKPVLLLCLLQLNPKPKRAIIDGLPDLTGSLRPHGPGDAEPTAPRRELLRVASRDVTNLRVCSCSATGAE